MNTGIALLTLSYVLSQFFRAFLAVLAEILERDIGTTPDDLAKASGVWFLVFAACQIPIGAALDRIGPRRTAGWLFLIGGGGGAAIFALATGPLHITLGMGLIGMGCAPVLMASYYIFARDYRPGQFALLASIMVGVGSLGNLFASYPMALAVQSIGWRGSLWGLAGVTTLVAIGLLLFVRDPARVSGGPSGSLVALFRIKALWLIFPLIAASYAFPGAVRGLWIGPYLADVFGTGTDAIGRATFWMSLAMIIGALAYGALDKVTPSRKWLNVGGALLGLVAGLILMLLPATSATLSIACMCAVGFFGAAYPVLMAHGRSFLPTHLIGRGVTMLNLFSMGGVGASQFVSGRIYRAQLPAETAAAPYTAVFTLFVVLLAFGCAVYLFSRDRPAE